MSLTNAGATLASGDNSANSGETFSFNLNGTAISFSAGDLVTDPDLADTDIATGLVDAINAAGITGVTAAVNADGTTIDISAEALDIELDTYLTEGADALFVGGVSVDTGSANDSIRKVAAIEVVLNDPSYNISSDVADTAGGLLAGANVAATLTGIGNADITGGNNVAAQTITINGESSVDLAVLADSDAETIAAQINQLSDQTGVSATAKTEATISNLSTDGVVSFELNGESISANVTTTDLSSLAAAINDESGKTGITAIISLDGASISLEHNTGEDISIDGFDSSAAVDGAAGTTVSLDIGGGVGAATQISAGGVNLASRDSTVVGGEIEFKSTGGYFSVSSNLTEETNGLFAGAADQLQASENNSVSSIDICTVDGAAAAIDIADEIGRAHV